MGQCLKDAYAERDLAKALAKTHGLIDEETRKLSDKVKELKLSHNRMRKLLILSKNFIEMVYLSNFVLYDNAEALHKRLYLELYGLEDYKTLEELLKGGV